jgi:hypothetical protein
LVPTVICLLLSPGHVKLEADAKGAAGELDAPTDDAGDEGEGDDDEGAGRDETAGADKEPAAVERGGGAAAVEDQLGAGVDDRGAELAAAAEELTDEPDIREAADTLVEMAGDELGTAAADEAGVTSSAPYTRRLNV